MSKYTLHTGTLVALVCLSSSQLLLDSSINSAINTSLRDSAVLMMSQWVRAKPIAQAERSSTHAHTDQWQLPTTAWVRTQWSAF